MSLHRLRPRARLVASALAVAAIVTGVAGVASATRAGTTPTYSIDFHVITAGGSAMSNPCYGLSGTIGQPAPGYSSASTYSIVAGFWAVDVAASDKIFYNGFQGC